MDFLPTAMLIIFLILTLTALGVVGMKLIQGKFEFKLIFLWMVVSLFLIGTMAEILMEFINGTLS